MGCGASTPPDSSATQKGLHVSVRAVGGQKTTDRPMLEEDNHAQPRGSVTANPLTEVSMSDNLSDQTDSTTTSASFQVDKVRKSSSLNRESVITERTQSSPVSERKTSLYSPETNRLATEGKARHHVTERRKVIGGEAGDAALRGRVDVEYPLTSKIVRIFTSSTFTGKPRPSQLLHLLVT